MNKLAIGLVLAFVVGLGCKSSSPRTTQTTPVLKSTGGGYGGAGYGGGAYGGSQYGGRR
jgi:hypothetical protein